MIDSLAYEDYLKVTLFGKGQSARKHGYFQRAIQEGPNYGPAYAGMATAYTYLDDMVPTEILSQAKAAAAKALEIDDSLGDAHFAVARVLQVYEWNFENAEKEYRKALRLNPNHVLAHAGYAAYLEETGRSEEALRSSAVPSSSIH